MTCAVCIKHYGTDANVFQNLKTAANIITAKSRTWWWSDGGRNSRTNRTATKVFDYLWGLYVGEKNDWEPFFSFAHDWFRIFIFVQLKYIKNHSHNILFFSVKQNLQCCLTECQTGARTIWHILWLVFNTYNPNLRILKFSCFFSVICSDGWCIIYSEKGRVNYNNGKKALVDLIDNYTGTNEQGGNFHDCYLMLVLYI
jgi:hypothetical protein